MDFIVCMALYRPQMLLKQDFLKKIKTFYLKH